MEGVHTEQFVGLPPCTLRWVSKERVVESKDFCCEVANGETFKIQC